MKITFKVAQPLLQPDTRLNDICTALCMHKGDGPDSTRYDRTTMEPALSLSEDNIYFLNIGFWREAIILIPIVLAVYQVEYIHVE